MTVTVKGKTFSVKIVALLEILNELTVVYEDTRAMSAIAADWEGADIIVSVDSRGNQKLYTGYTRIKRITREDNNETYIALGKVIANA